MSKLLLSILCIALVALNVFAGDDFFESETTIGGYGELHYNLNQTSETSSLDFHRFVLFVNHDWNENWSFNSEIELEHNFVNDGHGELELEQAAVDYHPSEKFGFKAGVVLAPVGLINLNHEPPLFPSVERPDYSKAIIPTTWFGNGVSFYGTIKDFSYNLTVMEGLNGDGLSEKSALRGGRYKGYKANAEKLLTALRVDYSGISGANIGFSYTMNQAVRTDADPIGIRLFELHAQYDAHNIISTFEFGDITLDSFSNEKAGGYYFDLGYKVNELFNLDTQIIPWVRVSDYNTAAATTVGGDMDKAYHVSKWLVGVAVKPIPNVVFKVDYGVATVELDKKETKLFNLGAGYMF